MPIALLLHEATAAFRFGARVLLPWNHLVRVEEVLIDRARSAFLFKWFGLGLPLHGFHARIAIFNLDELRRRYEQVKAEVRLRSEGPNLTEPLFGMAGVMAGMLLTPGVLTFSTVKIVQALDWNVKWYMVILQGFVSFIAILAAPFLGGAIAALSPVLAAGGFAGYLHMGVTGVPELRAFYDLMGTAAWLLESATRFIKLLLGDPAKIQNPILRGMMHLFHQFAKLFPFALALVAVIVTRFGPLLLPLAATVKAFIDLAGQLYDTIKFIFEDLVERAKALFDEENQDNVLSPIYRVLDWLEGAFDHLVKALIGMYDTAEAALSKWYAGVGTSLENWNVLFAEVVAARTQSAAEMCGIDETQMCAPAEKTQGFFGALGTNLKNLLSLHSTVVRLNNIIDAIKKAGAYLQSSKPLKEEKETPPSTHPFAVRARKWKAKAVKLGEMFPALPEFESPGEMIDRRMLKFKYMIPEGKGLKEFVDKVEEKMKPVSEAVTEYLQRVRFPAAVFAGEQKKLAAESGAKTLPEAMQKAQGEVTKLIHDLEGVVMRVLPPEMRHLLIELGGAAKKLEEATSLDKKKAGRKPKKPEEKGKPQLKFPVKDLPDNGLLRPVVQRLRLRSKSGKREELRDFLQLLQQKLDRRYTAPA